MKIKFLIGSMAFSILAIFALNSIYFTRISLWEIPTMLNATRAKEFCSCFFILKKGKDYCLDSVLHGYPMGGFMLDEKNKAVRFDLLWNSRLAIVRQDRYGCQLQ